VVLGGGGVGGEQIAALHEIIEGAEEGPGGAVFDHAADHRIALAVGCDQVLQPVAIDQAVGVGESKVLAAGDLQTGVARGAGIGALPEGDDAGLGKAALHQGGGVIPARVGDDDLEREIAFLVKDRCEGVKDVVLLVIGGDDHRNQWLAFCHHART